MSWEIKTPSRLQIVGPSEAGKSRLILRLVEDDTVWDSPFRKIIYAAPMMEDRRQYLDELRSACDKSSKKLLLIDTIPEVEEIQTFAENSPVLLIIDDILGFSGVKGRLEQIMVMHSHHLKISCAYCIQNPFVKTKHLDMTTISRNLTGRFVLYQRNDWVVYQLINSRIFPDKKSFLLDCLTDAKATYGYPYVFLNLHSFSDLPREYICYTGIFQDQREEHGGSPIFYQL